jgi:hypothetical protein
MRAASGLVVIAQAAADLAAVAVGVLAAALVGPVVAAIAVVLAKGSVLPLRPLKANRRIFNF